MWYILPTWEAESVYRTIDDYRLLLHPSFLAKFNVSVIDVYLFIHKLCLGEKGSIKGNLNFKVVV